MTRKPKRQSPANAHALSPVQWRCIEAELRGERPADVRARHKVAESTWYRWHDASQCPQYVTELERQRAEAFSAAQEAARAQLGTLVERRAAMLAVLEQMANDDTLEPRDRIRAAAECLRGLQAAIDATGFVAPQAPSSAAGAVNEVRAEIQQIREMIEAQGVKAILDATPDVPPEDEIDPRAALERERRITADLRAKLEAMGC